MEGSRTGDPRPKLTQKGWAMRQAILAAAADLFAAKGIAATSITEIAAKARVNRAMIAYYFGSKGGLYDAIIDDAVEAAAQGLAAAAPARAGDDPVGELIQTFGRVLAARPHLVRMIIHEYFEPARLFELGTANKLSGFVRLTEKVLKLAPLTPKARKYDPQIVHLIIVGALNYFILTDRFRGEMQGRLDRPLTRPSVDEFVRTLAEIVSRGLCRSEAMK